MKLAATALLALTVALALEGSTAAAVPAAVVAPTAVPWVSSDVTPIGRPIAVGGVVVGLVLRARHVYARGIAPDSGRMLWEHEVSPSAQPAGIEMAPSRVGSFAVLLQPEPAFGPDHARLSVVEPRTGREIHRSPAMLISSRPESCFGGRSVCMLATPSEEDPAQGYRLNLDSGALLPDPPSIPRGGRSLGLAGLIVTAGFAGPRAAALRGAGGSRSAGAEQIALVEDGVLRWRHPFAAALPQVASSAGTRWSRHAAEGVYTGSGYARGTRTGTSVTLDLGRDASAAGLDATDGRVLWRRSGAAVDCGGRIAVTGHAVRCRYRGTVTARTTTGSTRHAGLKVVLEGFDPRTGATRWSVPVGAAKPSLSSRPSVPTSDLSVRTASRVPTSDLSARTASRMPASELSARTASPAPSSTVRLAVGDGRLAIAGPNTVVIDGSAGPVLLDLRDGSVARPAPGAVFWCPKRTRFAYRDDGAARSGGDVYAACDAEGNPVAGTPSSGAVAAVAGGFAVVATSQGYIGTPSI